ncbi:hypothetical protein [Solirubrum puertoriconensis]|uniref:Uncharacterized protein n=1 Tax=Solirubrum puertoriconensis TaxID=1751427 RepID=A0A9X0L459_SOLP1|nr:hypothetical protein [Solirubrum puertoriconensis]KUG07269.1 hypothetical protein ASU33_12955 [Solirubrum puertoriconensis]
MEQGLKIAGGLLVVLAMVHAGFPRYFRWTTQFASVSLINRQMMYIHTLFIALVLLLMGLLCLTSAPELTGTAFGRKIALGCGVFWLVRLVVQFVGYSPSLWRGKPFETAAHLGLTMLWMYLSAVFLMAACG